MAKKLTRQELLEQIKKRRQIAEAKKRLEERRAKREATPVRRTARPLVERRTARKPVLTERTVQPTRRTILEQRNLTNRPARAQSLQENINQRNRAANLTKAQSEAYNVLANNIYQAQVNYLEATNKVINESATQAGPGVFGVTDNQAGVGFVQTFFDIFYGYFPELITPLIASVQPMKTEQGYIFYMQYTAGDTKGTVQKGDVLIDPFKVNTPEDFTSNRVVLAENVNPEGAFTKTQAMFNPVKPRGAFIEGAELVWTTDTAFTGTVQGKAITAGTLTVVGNDVTLAFTIADKLDKPVKVGYVYDNVFAPTDVPALTANVERLPIKAKYRTVKTNYAFTAAFGFEAEQGGNLGDKLAEAAMFELKRETDMEAIGEIFNAAPDKVVWNRDAGYAVGGYNDHKLSFLDAVVNAANIIYKKSKRVRGNVLLAGIDALNVIETLPMYDGIDTGDQLAGSRVVGKLKKMPVIAIPELPDNYWAVIYKNPVENLDAGLVFAPYIPVFATDPVTLDDLQVRRAYITAYAMKVVNPDYFVRGEIIKEPTALPIFLVSKDGTDTELGVLGEDAVLDILG